MIKTLIHGGLNGNGTDEVGLLAEWLQVAGQTI